MAELLSPSCPWWSHWYGSLPMFHSIFTGSKFGLWSGQSKSCREAVLCGLRHFASLSSGLIQRLQTFSSRFFFFFDTLENSSCPQWFQTEQAQVKMFPPPYSTVGIILSWYAVPDVVLHGPSKLFHFSFIGPKNNFGTAIVLSARFNHILKSFPAWCKSSIIDQSHWQLFKLNNSRFCILFCVTST